MMMIIIVVTIMRRIELRKSNLSNNCHNTYNSIRRILYTFRKEGRKNNVEGKEERNITIQGQRGR